LPAGRYDALLEEYHLADFLERPVVQPRRRHAFNSTWCAWPAVRRDALVRASEADQLLRDLLPGATARQECLRYLGHCEGDFPVSEEACRSVLALPLFAELTEEQQRRVVQSCATFMPSAVGGTRSNRSSLAGGS